jgi:transcriptional regulator with XRE-family HTH domain
VATDIALRKRMMGNFLKKCRTKAGLTQSEVADHLGYTSPQFVSNWERGVALPPLDAMPKLALLFNTPPMEFINAVEAYRMQVNKIEKRNLIRLFK